MEKKDVLQNEPIATGLPEKVWIASKVNVDKQTFEESRRCLLTVYHSYIQNHAGYLIALIIGLIALLSTSESFFRTLGSLGFWVSFGVVLALIFYDLLRMIYWNHCVSQAIGLSEEIAHSVETQNRSLTKKGLKIDLKNVNIGVNINK
jgi:hypothetical protein